MDLQDVEFIYPTTLLPLCAVVAKHNWEIVVDEKSKVGGYLLAILGKGLQSSVGKSYIAPIQLPIQQSKYQPVLERIYELRSRSTLFSENENVYKYVVGELVDNIYEHSQFKYAYVMAQKYGYRGFIELGFFDDGITIPGSFNKHGHKYDEENHYKAIDAAIRGISTKAGRERGFGLSSNVEMFRDLGGQILIVSGFGAIYVDGQKIIPYHLASNNKMDGTLISLRVKDVSRIVNIYEYLERAVGVGNTQR